LVHDDERRVRIQGILVEVLGVYSEVVAKYDRAVKDVHIVVVLA
jgi:hypothetical protein